MSRFTQSLRKLMPDCKAAIRLQSEALDRPLSRSQKIMLQIHLALCSWCSRYGKQIRFLRTAAQHCDHDHAPQQTLSPEARERMKRALEIGKNKLP